MERDMGHRGSDTPPRTIQHQFFPGAGGMQPVQTSNAEHLNGHVSSSSRDRNSGQGGVRPSHWDMKNWNWDSTRFAAQNISGGTGEACNGQQNRTANENGDIQRVSEIGFRLDRPSGTSQPGTSNEEEDSEHRGRSFLERETPSPPLNESRSSPRDDESPEEADGSLRLKLGADAYAFAEENGGGSRNGKRNRSSSPQSQLPTCQVDACKADLSKAKDYHRRHKVCEMHAKAVRAPVSRLMQRFCQQCSRFHPLAEFDEGKRSCRRRLAGHNRRRRKTQPDATAARAYWLAEEERLGKGGTGLIGSLLNILSQLTGSAPLAALNNPILDRDALLRKAVSASLEDINRTTPLWTQLLPNMNHLNHGFGQQVDQAGPANGHGADLAMETQRLLSRLTGPSPEALLLLLQNSLAAASMVPQNNAVSQMKAVAGPVQFPPGSSSGCDASGAYVRTSQTCAEPISTGVSHSLHSSPMPVRVTEAARGVPAGPSSLPHLSREHMPQPGAAPAIQRLFPPNVAVVNHSSTNDFHNHGQEVAVGGQVSTAGRTRSMLPYMGNHDPQLSSKAVSMSARPGINPQPHSVQQISDNSQSGSDEQSPTSSNARVEWTDRTRRIAFKLFDRTPGEFPRDLRLQIEKWLAHLPSNMESYIKPGCLVLTIFVAMPTSGWMELDKDLQASVEKLLKLCSDDFWHKGRILVQVERQTVFISDGEILDAKHLDSGSLPHIQSVRPLAVEAGQSTCVTFKGFNLTSSDTRIICAYEGKYLLQEAARGHDMEGVESPFETDNDSDNIYDTDEASDNFIALGKIDETLLFLDQSFTRSRDSTSAVGRCFLEVEHHMIGANTRPIIVADRSMCSELCMLEDEIDMAASHTARTAIQEGLEPVEVLGCSEVARLVVEEDTACFLHELGWFFQRGSHLQQKDLSILDMVHGVRLRCLLVFSVERNWCGVVRKLLDTVCEHKDISTGLARLSQVLQQDDLSLLHRAVRKKCRPMVELLLAYVPSSFLTENVTNKGGVGEQFGEFMQFKLQWGNLFRPDMVGLAGLTPLHIAASMQDAEDVVDALTSDPFQVGLLAWVNKCDDSGQTPLNYALAGRNFGSVQLVQNKFARLEGTSHELCIIMPPLPHDWGQQPIDVEQRKGGRSPAVQLAAWVGDKFASKKLDMKKVASGTCRPHVRRVTHFGGFGGSAFRPFLLSLVGIAAVCVCVGLVCKMGPTVPFVKPPFTWDGLDGGPK